VLGCFLSLLVGEDGKVYSIDKAGPGRAGEAGYDYYLLIFTHPLTRIELVLPYYRTVVLVLWPVGQPKVAISIHSLL